MKCFIHFIAKEGSFEKYVRKHESKLERSALGVSLLYSFIVTLVIMYLFLIINTLVFFWQVESWPVSALHYTETIVLKKCRENIFKEVLCS